MTSQIFANIYLNEFDRFVRHNLKPQAYLRYGDDVILFCPTRRTARKLRDEASNYLQSELNMPLNPKNDVIVAAKDGLHFLGHAVTDQFTLVDKHTTKSVLRKITLQNAASYRSLHLVNSARQSLDWQLIGQIDEILDI